MESLADGYVLMAVNKKLPTGMVKNRDLEIEVSTNHNVANADRVGVKVNLYDTDLLREVRKVHTRTVALFDNRTLPFYDKGFRLVKNEDVAEIKRMIEDAKIEADKLWEKFIDSYEDHINKDRTELGDVFDEALYPTVDEMRHKQDLDYTIAAVPDPNHDVRAGWDDDTKREFEERLKEQQKKHIKRAVSEMLNRICKAVERVEDRMKSYDGTRSGSFKDSLIENVKSATSPLSNYNILDSQEIDEIRQKIESEICKYDTNELRESEELRNEVAKSAEEILPRIRGFGKRIMSGEEEIK